jgi:hypothetical protein
MKTPKKPPYNSESGPVGDFGLNIKLKRISECAVVADHDNLARNLLHAYIACLTVEELCEAAVRTLSAPSTVRGAIRNRLIRLGREDVGRSNIDGLAHRLLDLWTADPKTRNQVDALLSQLYSFFDPQTRYAVLQRWRERGTQGVNARWLKAIEKDDLLFSVDLVLDYWRISGDSRAAKLLAYRAEPTLIAKILPELLQRCKEGWIISRAALSASSVSEEDWTRIRASFPATYAYLCAKTGRVLDEGEAIAIILEADPGSLGGRGLAIWAIGQIGLWSVLEQVEAMAPELREQELARLGFAANAVETKPARKRENFETE